MSELRRPRSIIGIIGGLVVIALLVGASAALRSRSGDSTSAARGASADRAAVTSIAMTVRNSLPVAVRVAATDVSGYDYSGLAPNDAAAFAGRELATGASASAVLGLNTNVTRGTFTLTLTSTNDQSLGSFAVGRGYVGYTCTNVVQGSVTVKDCSQRNVWWFDSSVPKSTSSSCPSSNRIEVGRFTDPTGVEQKVEVTATCSTTTTAETGEIGATTFTITAAPVPTKK